MTSATQKPFGRRHPWGFRIPDLPELGPDLCVRGTNGHVHAAIGLMATFYIEHGDTPEVREAMVGIYERYLEEVGPVFRWGNDPETFEPVPVADGVGDVRNWPTEIYQRFDFLMMFHGGATIDDADPHIFMAVSREREEGQLSFLTFGLPLSWGEKRSPEAFIAWVLDASDRLGAFHGYAGLGVLAPIGGVDDADVDAVYGLGKRFPGLEIDAPVHHESYLSVERRIKGVNWLTILGNDLIEKLGGLRALTSALGPEVTVHRTGTGVVLQAGPVPRFGDARVGERMDAYRQVARVLAPIRSLNPAIIWPQGTGSIFGFEDAKAWMSRFD